MRELTLRSALSFGSCYLLRMLCDEYLSFRLEQVASSPLLAMPSLPQTPVPQFKCASSPQCDINVTSTNYSNSSTNNETIEPIECPSMNLSSTCSSPCNGVRNTATTLLTTFNTVEKTPDGYCRDVDPPLWDSSGNQGGGSFVS